MPTDSRAAVRHRPPAPRRLGAKRLRKALRALLPIVAAAPAHPALCWWLAPYAARAASSRPRKP